MPVFEMDYSILPIASAVAGWEHLRGGAGCFYPGSTIRGAPGVGDENCLCQFFLVITGCRKASFTISENITSLND
jgi:hypothetical protein